MINRVLKNLFIYLILCCNVYATEFSQLHTHNVRAVVKKLTGYEIPHIQVCLRHYLSGDCLHGKSKNFFSCESSSIDSYIACISDPNLDKKIKLAYAQMHEQAKKEIEIVKKDKKLDPAQKQVMLARMQESIDQFDQMAKSESAVDKQILDALESFKRFDVAAKLNSQEFRSKIEDICSKHPNACLSVKKYDEKGQELLLQFNKRFSDADTEFLANYGESLESALETEIDLAIKCLKNNQDTFCKTFTPDPNLIKAVTQEIETGICNHRKLISKMAPQLKKRFALICDEFQPYLRFLSQEAQRSKTGKAEAGKSDDEKTDGNAYGKDSEKDKSEKSRGSSYPTSEDTSQNGSSEGGAGGEEGGKNTNKTGLDWFSWPMEEKLYSCDKVDTAIKPHCNPISDAISTSETSQDLYKSAVTAANECSKEVNEMHKTQMDAASYLLETQIKAYIDRLNLDSTISKDEYKLKINELKLSCKIPVSVPGQCDYDKELSIKMRDFLSSHLDKAFQIKNKIGFNKKLSKQFLEDTSKAAIDLANINASLKDLLKNFPNPGKSIKERYSEMLPCQSVVSVMDDIRDIWNESHYDSRCAPLEVSENELIYQGEEEIFQYFKSIELGLVEGVTINTLPKDERTQSRLKVYQKLKADKKYDNDLVKPDPKKNSKILVNSKHNVMFRGLASETGRLLIEPGGMSGLESRKLECKKKALQVQKLMNLKLSLLANYPQLGNKTFSNGKKPSVQWNYWDEHCRGTNRMQTFCPPNGTGCISNIKRGCEKEPKDWNTQEKTKNLYERMGKDPKENKKIIAKQFALDQAEEELGSLKKSVGKICEDPLDAGEEILKNDKLYTLYASCATNNIENGERRDVNDLDQYQFWSQMNNSALVRQRCARRASSSYERCRIVRNLDSEEWNMFKRGAASVASPLVNTLDFASCVALFTGVGGAVYYGVKAGVQSGVMAGVKAGSNFIGAEVFEAGKSVVGSWTGRGVTAVGLGLSYHYQEEAIKNLDYIRARHSAGLASLEELEEAQRQVEETKLSNNLQTILAGAFLPAGGAGKGKLGKLANKADNAPTSSTRQAISKVDDALDAPNLKLVVKQSDDLADSARPLSRVDDVDVPRSAKNADSTNPAFRRKPTSAKKSEELKKEFAENFAVENTLDLEKMGLPTTRNNRAYLDLHSGSEKQVVVFSSEMSVLKDGNDLLGREAMTAAENMYQQTMLDVLQNADGTGDDILWRSISRKDDSYVRNLTVPVGTSKKNLSQILDKIDNPSKLSARQRRLLQKLKEGKISKLSGEDVALLYRTEPALTRELKVKISPTDVGKFRKMLNEYSEKFPLSESEKSLKKILDKAAKEGSAPILKAEFIGILDGMSTQVYTGFKSFEGAIDFKVYKKQLAKKMGIRVSDLSDDVAGQNLRKDLGELDNTVKQKFANRLDESGIETQGLVGQQKGVLIQEKSKWKQMGVSKIPPTKKVGSPIDEAASATRSARSSGDGSIAVYDDAIRTSVVEDVALVEGKDGTRSSIMDALDKRGFNESKLAKDGFLSEIPKSFLKKHGYRGKSAQFVISEKVWSVVRKTDKPEELLERLNNLFPEMKFTLKDAKNLREQYNALDSWSPSIHSQSRGSLPVSEGVGNGGVLDVQGLGGLNAQWNDTAFRVARLTGKGQEADSVIALARSAEVTGSTPAFKKRVEGMVESLQSELGEGWVVRSSGDDVIFYPERRTPPPRRNRSDGGRRADYEDNVPAPKIKQIQEEDIDKLVLSLNDLAKKANGSIEYGGTSLSRATFVRGSKGTEAHVSMLENLEKSVRKKLEKEVGKGSLSGDDLASTVIGFDSQVPETGDIIIRVVVPKGNGITKEMLENYITQSRSVITSTLEGRAYKIQIDEVAK